MGKRRHEIPPPSNWDIAQKTRLDPIIGHSPSCTSPAAGGKGLLSKTGECIRDGVAVIDFDLDQGGGYAATVRGDPSRERNAIGEWNEWDGERDDVPSEEMVVGNGDEESVGRGERDRVGSANRVRRWCRCNTLWLAARGRGQSAQ